MIYTYTYTYTYTYNMSNFCPSRCKTCGNSISQTYELFLLLKKNLVKDTETHINNIGVDFMRNDNVDSILNILKITRHCCRTHFLSTITLLDLEMKNMG